MSFIYDLERLRNSPDAALPVGSVYLESAFIMDSAERKGSMHGLYTSQVRHVSAKVVIFCHLYLYRFGCPIEKRKSMQYSACTRVAQPSACTGLSTPGLRPPCTDTSGPDCWSSFTSWNLSNLWTATIVNHAPSFPCPQPDLKATLRVADFPRSCTALYPEHPFLRGRVRLIVAAVRHLRVCQLIGHTQRAEVPPQSSAVGRGYLYYQEGW